MAYQPNWIPLQAFIDIHRLLLEEHGGVRGFKDQQGLVIALLQGKKTLETKREPGLPALAAALAWGLAKNHPFVDGNKRMALMAIGVFLGLNGMYLDAREDDAFQVMTALAGGELSEDQLAAWVAEHAYPLTDE